MRLTWKPVPGSRPAAGLPRTVQPCVDRLGPTVGAELVRARTRVTTRRVAELRRCRSEGSAEFGGKMAVAREADVKRQFGQVGRVRQFGKRAREPQLSQILVQCHAFELTKHLGEIDRRRAHRAADLGEMYRPGEFGVEKRLRSLDQPLRRLSWYLDKVVVVEHRSHKGQDELLRDEIVDG